MFKNNDHKSAEIETGLISFCDQIIIATLLVIVITVSLFFGVQLYSVFDLSKITILYILAFTIMAIWDIKTIIICLENNKQVGYVQENSEGMGNSRWAGIFGYKHNTFRLAQPLNLPIIAFLFVSGLATIFSINPYISLVGTYKRYDGFISTIVYVFLFYVIVNFIDRKRLNTLLNVIILTACFASIYGILQHFRLDLFKWSMTFGASESTIRVASTFGHPAFFSAFLVMVIPLVLFKIFSCKERFKTYLYIGILALLTVTFYYTKTRACFLGFIISNLFFFSLIGMKNLFANKAKTILTLSVLVGISFFYSISDKTSPTGRFIHDIWPEGSPYHDVVESETHFGRQLGGSMFMRVFQYTTGLKIIYDYPILGIGPDTLGMIYPPYLADVYKKIGEYKFFQNQNRIHNDFLDITVSRGLLGLGVYIWFIFAYSRMVWKGYKKANGLHKILVIALCSSCLSYFIQNQFSFGHIPIITLFWFLIGMSVIVCHTRYSLSNGVRNPLTNVPHRQKNGQTITRRVNNLSLGQLTKTVFCGLIVCLMILLITLSLLRYKADIYFKNGRSLLYKNSIIETIGSLEMAVRLNPLQMVYRNVLNGVYLKMADIALNKDGDSIKINEDIPDYFTKEQATIWLTNAIVGSKEVQKLYPRDYHSAFTLGHAYHIIDRVSDKDMSKDAIKYYKQAITLHPFKFRLRDKLAQLYAEKGYYEDAIQELKEAVRILPTNPLPYVNLANIFTMLGRYEDARKSCNHILELRKSMNGEDDKYAKFAKRVLENLPKTQVLESVNSSDEKGRHNPTNQD